MKTSGGQIGNRNAARGKELRDAFRYAVAKLGRDVAGDEAAYTRGLQALCMRQVKAAFDGDGRAMQLVTESIYGRPALGGEGFDLDGDVIETEWEITFVEATESEFVN